ncbi:hypothetical protein [Streptomyces sp. NPDC047108]|uniref:hypothetical protein n=1 Tax=Streptomyces sp. NPDC047108 TaxID=3155025 RepID=UPI0034032A85
MASHARSKSPVAARVQGVPGALLRAGLVVAAAGAALAAGSGAAGACPLHDGHGQCGKGPQASPAATGGGLANSLADPGTSLREGTKHGLGGVSGPLKSMQLNPLANTGVDPLDNGVGTQVADFKPVGTQSVTDNVTRGQSMDDLPLLGPVAGKLPGGWAQ